MLAAALVLAQAIALDPASGVWFPPEGWRDQYVERRRSYSQDVRQAFARDPKLATAVCAAVAAAPQPAPSVDPSLRQLRSMLDMMCVAMRSEARERPAQEARAQTVDAFLTRQLDEAAAAIAPLAPNERKTNQRSLLTTIDSMGPSAERLAAIFRAIVLRPQDARGAWLLLRAADDTGAMNRRVEARELAAFVERLYRSRAAADGPEALQWENGLPEVLLYLGKDEEARRLQTDQVAKARNDLTDYDRIELAVLDEIAGRSGAVHDAFSRCRDAQACRDAVWSFATRTAEIRGQTSPKVIGDLLAMTLPWYPDWQVRMYTTRLLMPFSPSRARQEVTAMYALENIPDGVMLDLVLLDAQLAAVDHDPLRTIALRDCWLILLGVRVAPFPADGWARLAAWRNRGTASGREKSARPPRKKASCSSRAARCAR